MAGLLEGERRALGRLLTVIENGEPREVRETISCIYPHTGRARVVGITGSPGVGKSTLTNALATALREQDRSVGILAVDPSSPFSGGALLGDRVRMQRHHGDEQVFIRSMAARGHLGGVSLATPQALLVMDAAGFDDVIVETVGVGQSEVEVAATADTTIVAVAPGMGDAVQAAKAGVLEIADVFVINKTDQGGAGQVESQLHGMLELGAEVAAGAGPAWTPPILRTVAVRGEGLPELVEALDDHERFLTTSGKRDERRHERNTITVCEIALASLRRTMVALEDDGQPLIAALASRVGARALDPYEAADELLGTLSRTLSAE